MKIVVAQMHYPKGHRSLDQEYMKILSKDHELLIVDDGEYFTDEFCSMIRAERIRVRPLMVKRVEFFQRILHYINLTIIFLTLKLYRKDYDALLFLNIHNAFYYYKFFPKKKIVIFHHQDIDAALSYAPYSEVFKRVANNYLHICLAGFIKEGLIEKFGVKTDKVFVVHQPLVFDSKKYPEKKENLLIGIGRSTDEMIIRKMLEYDKKLEGDCNNSFIMRSKQIEYRGKVLTVMKGYMPREEYEALYDRAKVSVVTYPSEYKLRYSGIIDDSLSKGLVVFANDNPCSCYFASIYPTCVHVFKKPEDLWNMIRKELPTPDSEELRWFTKRHSEENVRKQLNSVLEA